MRAPSIRVRSQVLHQIHHHLHRINGANAKLSNIRRPINTMVCLLSIRHSFKYFDYSDPPTSINGREFHFAGKNGQQLGAVVASSGEKDSRVLVSDVVIVISLCVCRHALRYYAIIIRRHIPMALAMCSIMI